MTREVAAAPPMWVRPVSQPGAQGAGLRGPARTLGTGVASGASCGNLPPNATDHSPSHLRRAHPRLPRLWVCPRAPRRGRRQAQVGSNRRQGAVARGQRLQPVHHQGLSGADPHGEPRDRGWAAFEGRPDHQLRDLHPLPGGSEGGPGGSEVHRARLRRRVDPSRVPVGLRRRLRPLLRQGHAQRPASRDRAVDRSTHDRGRRSPGLRDRVRRPTAPSSRPRHSERSPRSKPTAGPRRSRSRPRVGRKPSRSRPWAPKRPTTRCVAGWTTRSCAI